VDFLLWVEGLPFSIWVAEGETLWAYPAIITFHTIGLAMVCGANALLDLRLLGVGRRLPVEELRGVFTVMTIGFVVNGSTGVALLMAAATRLGVQPMFYYKLGLVLLAVLVAFRQRSVVFTSGAAARNEVPAQARTLAIASLLLWVAATTSGRLVAYF